MRRHHLQSGFTLIELIIAVSLTVMLLLTASALFMTFLISGAKVNSTQLVKQEGQHALIQMEFLLRNAIELLPNSFGDECIADMTEIKFRSIDGGETTLAIEDDGGVDKIASNSGVYLTSGAVKIVNGINFTCTQNSDESHPHISISFTLRKGTPGLDPTRDIVQETFTASATVRSL
ncbi:type II secretion system GspH family protein [Patescibacteria group bacterium]|nr:type II secretion system GspH family protein [Patescibacteria group bacterium]MBU1967192.1 type II secretion system GspH family protein [Patescibacteria group bacterium]